MGDIAPNFSAWEFDQRDPHVEAPNPPSPYLIAALQAIRSYFGPVIITSGFRTEDHNRNVGGHPSSKHLSNKAADFYVEGVDAGEIYDWCNLRFPTMGLGLYVSENRLHLDSGGSGRRWIKD